MQFDPSSYEPLLDDDRVERLAHKLLSEFGHGKLEGAEFVTFIQPPRSGWKRTDDGVEIPYKVPEMAVFAILTPRPRATKPGQRLMSTGTVALRDWREAEADAGHYAGAPDEAHKIFRVVVADHVRKLDDLNSMIDVPAFRN